MTATEWSLTCPEKGYRSVATVAEISRAQRFKGDLAETRHHGSRRSMQVGPPGSWISGRSRLWIKCEPLTSPTSHCRGDSCTWWRSWMNTPGMYSAGSSPTALTQSSVWRLWSWHSAVAAGRRSSTPIKDAVNLNRLHGPVAVGGDQDQMLRKEALLGQHPGGELVENGQVRGGLSTGLQRELGC